MSQLPPSEKQLLKTFLEPLLEDFRYWFSRSRNLLESERITFLSEAEQADLLERIIHSQQQVSTAQMLFQATEGRAGIDMAVVMPWHQLVAECWQVSRYWRSLKTKNEDSST